MLANKMTFGDAVEALKKGHKVRRRVWTDGHMRLFLTSGQINAGYVLEEEAGGDPVLSHIDGIKAELFHPIKGDVITIHPVIGSMTEHKGYMPYWTATQEDILAEDWELFNI